MKETIFKFIFKDKIFPVQPFEKLMNISKRVRNSLIFSQDHTYEIDSKVKEENVIKFIECLIDNKEPELTINNINEYETLSYEFEIYETIIQTKKTEYGEYLITLVGLDIEDKNMKRKYETEISNKLDDYIEHYGEELLNKPIETLYNIFRNSEGQFNKQDEIYEYIKKHYERTGDSNIFILLDFLDGKRMLRQNIEESFSEYSTRNNHMPKIDFSTINEYFERQRRQEEQLLKYEHINEEQQKKITYLLQEEEERTQHIKTLETQLNKFIQIINNIDHQMNEQRTINENLKQQIIQNNHEQNQKYETLLKEQRQEINNLLNQDKERAQHITTLETQINKFIQNNDYNDHQMKEQQKIIDNLQTKINELENKNKAQTFIDDEQKTKITSLETPIETLIKSSTTTATNQNNCQPFEIEIDKTVPGLLQILKNNEKSPFDPLFIASQSSGDIYNIINPETKDSLSLKNIGKYIELKLEKPVKINGIKIFSSIDSFPKSFDIVINDENVASIQEANELNGSDQSMTININLIECQKIRIINKGKNWDKNNHYMRIKRIELLSNETKYTSGVFSTLISETRNHDPHSCPVFISASNFDFNTFYLINSRNKICTFKYANSWFQIEFTKGKAIIYGFRLKRCDPGKMKSYKIICADDVYQSRENWITLFEINEESPIEHNTIDIYKLSNPSPPIKYIRIIQTEPNWCNELYLKFYHLDFFGSYI